MELDFDRVGSTSHGRCLICSIFWFFFLFSSIIASKSPNRVSNVNGIAVATNSHQFLAKSNLLVSLGKAVRFIPKKVLKKISDKSTIQCMILPLLPALAGRSK